MIAILALSVLGLQSVDKAWVRSMQELLALNPAASVSVDLKDTLGNRTVFLDDEGKVLRTDAGVVHILINPTLHVVSTQKKVDDKIKLFVIDRSGIRFQSEYNQWPQTTWIGDELFTHGESVPTERISQKDGAPWTLERWPNLKTNNIVPGVEPGTYFATIDWPDHKDAYTKIVSVSADGTTSNPTKYDSTRQSQVFCPPGPPKITFENESSEFVVASPNSGTVQKYPSESFGRAWLSQSQSLAFIRKNVGDVNCRTHFSLFRPKTNRIEYVESPGKSIRSFVALGPSSLLVYSGRQYYSCLFQGGGQQGGTYMPKKEPITDEKPESDLFWFDPKSGKSRKLAEFIPSATVYLELCRATQ